MPVPISTNNTTTALTSDLYKKFSVDDLNNIYKELLRNKNSIKQNVTAQIYFKNYIQDSLRFLREKAKEHEAKLRNQIQLSNALDNSSPTNSVATSLTVNTNTNSVAIAQANSNQKSLKVVKIQTNKRNNIKQLASNQKPTGLVSKGYTNKLTQSSRIREQSNEIQHLSPKLVKPTVTNKCKLEMEHKKQVKQIFCVNKKPQIVKVLPNINSKVTTPTLTTNKPLSLLSKNKTNKQSLTLKRGGKDVKLKQQKESKALIDDNKKSTNTKNSFLLFSPTTSKSPSSNMFYTKKINRSIECLEDFNDFLRNNASYNGKSNAAPTINSQHHRSQCYISNQHSHQNHHSRHRSRHHYPSCASSKSNRYTREKEWEDDSGKHLRQYERDPSDRYYSSNRYSGENASVKRNIHSTCRKSRSKSKYRDEYPEESVDQSPDKLPDSEKHSKVTQNENKENISFSPEIPEDVGRAKRKSSNNARSKRDKSVSILSKSSVSYTQTPHTKSNTTIAVQTSPSQISINTINETSYVKELKSQLEVLKTEIARLQSAQSNLEKTLKQQSTVIRPIIYTGYPDQEYNGYGFDQFIQSDYKIQNEQISKEISAAMGVEQYMMMPENSTDVNSLFYNQNGQSLIYEPSTANFEEAVRSQLTSHMNSVDLNKATQNPSIKKTTEVQNKSNNSTAASVISTNTLVANEEPNKLKQTILNKIDTDLMPKKIPPVFSSNSTPHPSVKFAPSPTILKDTKNNNASTDTATFQNSKNISTDLPPSIIISNPSQQFYKQQHQQHQQQAPVSPNAQLYQKLLKLISSSSSYSEQINSQMSTLLANPNIKAQLKQLHSQLLKNPNQYLPQLESILLDKEGSPVTPRPPPPPTSVHEQGTDLSVNRTQKKTQQQSFENYSVGTNNLISIPTNMTKNNTSNTLNNNNNSNKSVYLASEFQHHCQDDLLDLREYYAKDEAKRYVSVNSSIGKNQSVLSHSQRNNSREPTKQ